MVNDTQLAHLRVGKCHLTRQLVGITVVTSGNLARFSGAGQAQGVRKRERERLYVSVSFLPLRVAGKTAILANKADGTATETTTSSLDWQGTGGQRATGM